MFLAILDGSCQTSGQTLDITDLVNLWYSTSNFLNSLDGLLQSLKSGVGHKSWKDVRTWVVFLLGFGSLKKKYCLHEWIPPCRPPWWYRPTTARLQIWSPQTFSGCQGSCWISTPNQSRCRRARNATWKPPWCAGTFDRRPLESISCVSFWKKEQKLKVVDFLEILPFQPYPKHLYFTAFSKPLTVTPV